MHVTERTEVQTIEGSDGSLKWRAIASRCAVRTEPRPNSDEPGARVAHTRVRSHSSSKSPTTTTRKPMNRFIKCNRLAAVILASCGPDTPEKNPSVDTAGDQSTALQSFGGVSVGMFADTVLARRGKLSKSFRKAQTVKVSSLSGAIRTPR